MRILSVSEAMSYLRELLETDLVLGDVWISGEVSGPRSQPSGHTYFTLKDAGTQLRGVLFRSAMVHQRRMGDHLLHGAQVIVHGRLTVYEARGELQVVVDFVQPEGVGLQQAQYERLRAQLEEEGLFDPLRKRPLPYMPRKVGVVTSGAGAVFHDICNVLRRRWPLAEVVLSPSPVQGPEAAPGVVAALESLNERGDIDVIIVGRGGGSAEELSAFNEESVARAVFGSLVPVVSAVGHETDFTICDYVADLRAPTPSAAAELIAPDRLQVAEQVYGRLEGAFALLQRRLAQQASSLGYLVGRSERAATDVERWRRRLTETETRALAAVQVGQRLRAELLQNCQTQLTALDPQATLNRGYAVVHKAGGIVTSIADVSAGDGLVIKVADGGFPARAGTPSKRRSRAPAARNGNSEPADSSVQPVLFI